MTRLLNPTGKGCDDRRPDQQPEDGQCNMCIGVARPYHHPIVAVQQQKAVETIKPGFHSEKSPSRAEPCAMAAGEIDRRPR